MTFWLLAQLDFVAGTVRQKRFMASLNLRIPVLEDEVKRPAMMIKLKGF